MHRWLGAGFLGCVWLMACGGKLVDSGSPAAAGASDAGSAGAAASSAGANTTIAGNASVGSAGTGQAGTGQADAAASCSPEGYPVCAASCDGQFLEDNAQIECVGGTWRCPAPLIDVHGCPPESCILAGVWCCDHTFGTISQPECGADGVFGPCPTGFERNAQVCVADSAHTTDCSTLNGKSCSLEKAHCNRRDVRCECGPGDGGLSWDCTFLPI
ncbi:MAG: hypothetical protein ABW061_12480 [Polyangiaceae bacterium]